MPEATGCELMQQIKSRHLINGITRVAADWRKMWNWGQVALMADAHASFQAFARKAPAGRIVLGPPSMDFAFNAMYFAFFAEAKWTVLNTQCPVSGLPN